LPSFAVASVDVTDISRTTTLLIPPIPDSDSGNGTSETTSQWMLTLLLVALTIFLLGVLYYYYFIKGSSQFDECLRCNRHSCYCCDDCQICFNSQFQRLVSHFDEEDGNEGSEGSDYSRNPIFRSSHGSNRYDRDLRNSFGEDSSSDRVMELTPLSSHSTSSRHGGQIQSHHSDYLDDSDEENTSFHST
jgi:hypothetical protein